MSSIKIDEMLFERGEETELSNRPEIYLVQEPIKFNEISFNWIDQSKSLSKLWYFQR